MSKQDLQRIARAAHQIGGWLLCPLFFFCAYGAFQAVAEGDYQALVILVLLMAWSGFEFHRFTKKRGK